MALYLSATFLFSLILAGFYIHRNNWVRRKPSEIIVEKTHFIDTDATNNTDRSYCYEGYFYTFRSEAIVFHAICYNDKKELLSFRNLENDKGRSWVFKKIPYDNLMFKACVYQATQKLGFKNIDILTTHSVNGYEHVDLSRLGCHPTGSN